MRERAVLVTGAAAGLGRAIAPRLVNVGCTVAVTDVDEYKAETVAKEIGVTGRTAIARWVGDADALVSRMPLQLAQTTNDVAAATTFRRSPDVNRITDRSLSVDGGLLV